MTGDARPTVAIDGLSVQRGRQALLNNVSLTVNPGQVIGVLGHNGAGKTTLMEAMLGFCEPSAGTVRLWGVDVARLGAAQKQQIAYVPQQDEFPANLSVQDSLNLYSAFYPRWDHALAERLLADWRIERTQRVRLLSGGQRQKLSIVLALAQSPELIVLDEPVASLDPIARSLFLQQLTRHLADRQRALVISSHIVADLEGFINTLWLLRDGTVQWQGPVGEVAPAFGLPAGTGLEQVYRRAMQA